MSKTSGWWKGLLALAALVAFGLAGCGGPEPTSTAAILKTDLPFETIERADSSGTGQYYEGKDPKLVVLTEAGEYEALGNTVSVEAQMQLRDINYGEYLVVAVFQGWRPSVPTPQSGVEIHTISIEENTITIQAHFFEPVEGYEQLDTESSPYHLVKVRRREDMQGETEFILNVDGTMVSRQIHHLPGQRLK